MAAALKSRRWTRGGAAAAAEHDAEEAILPPQTGSSSSSTAAVAKDVMHARRLLFVGNSHTYQPKELGGVKDAVKRLAATSAGITLQCDEVVQGGADLVDLWEAFEQHWLNPGDEQLWDTVVLQVSRGADPNSHFAMLEVLRHRYAPLLLQR
eukprot:TRINITY_DN70703_c0_g1_i1.p1 TRINITY_DN70703_c0_g1~~TRINITY_DN70703_c0_g1_i1.p1  ORF type:complete len:166 (-),score=35.56 TRINITY_DN70703_c0_g1_i1:403-858(-)